MSVNREYNSKYLKMYSIPMGSSKYLFSSRKEHEVELKNTNKADAVTCITILKFPNCEAKLLLSYEYRYPLGMYVLSPTAGCVDAEDTTLEETARREIYEELGLNMNNPDDCIKVINNAVFSSPGMTDESNALVLCIINVNDDFNITREYAVGDESFNGYEILNKEDAIKILTDGVDKYGNNYPVYTWCALMYFVSGMWISC